MENILNEYPEYKKNQVLTDVSLNTSFNFLAQQERLSRFGLTQTGIIEDLRYTVARTAANKINSITINKGFGVSTDGYFMPHNYNTAALTYTHYKVYSFVLKPKQINAATIVLTTRNEMLNELAVPPFAQQPLANTDFTNIAIYELLTEQMAALEAHPLPLSGLVSGNYKLALFLETNVRSSENCTPNSCDDGGNLVTQRTLPLLIADAANLLIKPINCKTEPKKLLRLKRFSNLCLLRRGRKTSEEILTTEYSRLNTQNTIALLEKLYSVNVWPVPLSVEQGWQSQNKATLQAGLQQLEAIMAKYIPSVFRQDYPYNYGHVALQTGKSIPRWTTAFQDKVKERRSFWLKNTTPDTNGQTGGKYFQYYYDFCMDLEKAVNEFVIQYNRFIAQYKTGYQHRLRQMLVLGQVPASFEDPYAYHSIDNFANTEFRRDKDMFFRHFNRIFVLIRKFDQGFAELKYKTDIKLVPSRSRCCLLEEQAIPFYYRQDQELDRSWIVSQVHHPLKTNIYQYRDLEPPYSHFAYNLNDYNSMRIEGLVGQKRETVQAELDNLKYYFNIPLYYTFINIDELVLDFDDVGGSAVTDEKNHVLRNTFAGLEHIGGVEFGFRFLIFYKEEGGDVIADFQFPAFFQGWE